MACGTFIGVCRACMPSVILLKCVGRKFCCKYPRVTVSGATDIHIVGDLRAGNSLKNVTCLLKRKYMK
jgi:hypothetical protein